MKVHSGISWSGYKRLSNALSREFDDDPVDSDDENEVSKVNIGHYDAALLYLQPTRANGLLEELEVEMPRLPSRYMLRKEEVAICREYGGFDVSDDGLATTRDFDTVLKMALEKHANIRSVSCQPL
jgi:hypothetical protein